MTTRTVKIYKETLSNDEKHMHFIFSTQRTTHLDFVTSVNTTWWPCSFFWSSFQDLHINPNIDEFLPPDDFSL